MAGNMHFYLLPKLCCSTPVHPPHTLMHSVLTPVHLMLTRECLMSSPLHPLENLWVNLTTLNKPSLHQQNQSKCVSPSKQWCSECHWPWWLFVWWWCARWTVCWWCYGFIITFVPLTNTSCLGTDHKLLCTLNNLCALGVHSSLAHDVCLTASPKT